MIDTFVHDSHTSTYFFIHIILMTLLPNFVGQEMASETPVVSPGEEDQDFKVVQEFLERRGSSSLTLPDVYR